MYELQKINGEYWLIKCSDTVNVDELAEDLETLFLEEGKHDFSKYCLKLPSGKNDDEVVFKLIRSFFRKCNCWLVGWCDDSTLYGFILRLVAAIESKKDNNYLMQVIGSFDEAKEQSLYKLSIWGLRQILRRAKKLPQNPKNEAFIKHVNLAIEHQNKIYKYRRKALILLRPKLVAHTSINEFIDELKAYLLETINDKIEKQEVVNFEYLPPLFVALYYGKHYDRSMYTEAQRQDDLRSSHKCHPMYSCSIYDATGVTRHEHAPDSQVENVNIKPSKVASGGEDKIPEKVKDVYRLKSAIYKQDNAFKKLDIELCDPQLAYYGGNYKFCSYAHIHHQRFVNSYANFLNEAKEVENSKKEFEGQFHDKLKMEVLTYEELLTYRKKMLGRGSKNLLNIFYIENKKTWYVYIRKNTYDGYSTWLKDCLPFCNSLQKLSNMTYESITKKFDGKNRDFIRFKQILKNDIICHYLPVRSFGSNDERLQQAYIFTRFESAKEPYIPTTPVAYHASKYATNNKGVYSKPIKNLELIAGKVFCCLFELDEYRDLINTKHAIDVLGEEAKQHEHIRVILLNEHEISVRTFIHPENVVGVAYGRIGKEDCLTEKAQKMTNEVARKRGGFIVYLQPNGKLSQPPLLSSDKRVPGSPLISEVKDETLCQAKTPEKELTPIKERQRYLDQQLEKYRLMKNNATFFQARMEREEQEVSDLTQALTVTKLMTKS